MDFKKIFLTAFFAVSSLLLFSQNTWSVNLDNTLASAKKDKKHVLLYFSGSDWCMPCKMLDRDIFETKEFKDYAQKNLLLVKADFPRRAENKLSTQQQNYNSLLGQKYGVRGMPTVVLLNSEGAELNRIVGYPRMTPQAFVQDFIEVSK